MCPPPAISVCSHCCILIHVSTAQLSTNLSQSQMFVQLMQMMQKMENGLLARMDKMELRFTAMDEKLDRKFSSKYS